jgi:hypothetical protein
VGISCRFKALNRLHLPQQEGEEDKLLLGYLTHKMEAIKFKKHLLNMSQLTRWKFRKFLNGLSLEEI